MEQLANSEIQDKISSGIIAIYGEAVFNQTEIIDDFRNIDQRLKGKLGERVLIISRNERIINCVGFGAEPEIVVDTKVVLGELNGEELVFDYTKQTCSIPTSRFASSDEDSDVEISNIVIGQSNLFNSPNSFDGCKLRDTVGDWGFLSTHPISLERFPALEILIGDEEIRAWPTAEIDRWPHVSVVEIQLTILENRLYNCKLF